MHASFSAVASSLLPWCLCWRKRSSLTQLPTRWRLLQDPGQAQLQQLPRLQLKNIKSFPIYSKHRVENWNVFFSVTEIVQWYSLRRVFPICPITSLVYRIVPPPAIISCVHHSMFLKFVDPSFDWQLTHIFFVQHLTMILDLRPIDGMYQRRTLLYSHGVRTLSKWVTHHSEPTVCHHYVAQVCFFSYRKIWKR